MMRWMYERWAGGCRALRGQATAPLVVALAIVAASAGLIPPVFSSRPYDPARERSMRNLRTLALATRMYMDDWEGTFPGWQRNPDTTPSNNVWDQQIYPYIRRNDVYFNWRPKGFRSCADPGKLRILSYGLNGFLIATPPAFNGSVRQHITYGGAFPPRPLRVATVTRPADTILFAELETRYPVSSIFQSARWPYVTDPAPNGSEAWNAALVHWIDISPREWVETSTGNESRDSYDPTRWDPRRGVARDLYGGGGNYAFVDGHVEFQKLAETVGLGRTITTGTTTITVTPGNVAWSSSNNFNQWNPRR